MQIEDGTFSVSLIHRIFKKAKKQMTSGEFLPHEHGHKQTSNPPDGKNKL